MCRELKPEIGNSYDFYEEKFKMMAIDEAGLVDLNTFRECMMSMGQKISEANIDLFLKHVKTEESGKIKVSSIVERLSSVIPLV